MKTAFDLPQTELDEHDTKFLNHIKQNGFFTTAVFEDDEGPGFSYTTGFYQNFKHPEIIVFGCKPELAHDIFWNIYSDIEQENNITPLVYNSDILINSDVIFFPVETKLYNEYLGWSNWFYRGNSFPCLQLVWPDKDRNFPWHETAKPDFKKLQVDVSKGSWQNANISC